MQALYFAALAVLSIDLLFLGMVIGYFQKKIMLADLVKIFATAFFASLFVLFGQYAGKMLANWFSERSGWYAATFLFLLGIKVIYDKLKLGKHKQLINPLENKGLITLTLLFGINGIIVGLAFGLLSSLVVPYVNSLIFLIVITLLGYFIGFNVNKMLSRKYELISGFLYIIIAILVVSNI